MNTYQMELMAKYFSGNTSPEEERRLMDWVNLSEANRQWFKQTEEVWASMPDLKTRQANTSQEWDKLLRTLKEEEKPIVPLRNIWKPALVAASLLLVVLGSFWIWSMFSSTEPETLTENISKKKESTTPVPLTKESTKSTTPAPRLQEFKAGNQMEAFRLPDHSLVWLKANTTLSYAPGFETNRTLYLDGEAYFEVKRDTLHPFRIHCHGSITEVLGTTFVVKGYEKDEHVEVAVASGKVAFAPQVKGSSKLLLTKNDKAVWKKKSTKTTQTKTDTEALLSWTDQGEEYKNTTLYKNEIAKPLGYLKPEFKWKKTILGQLIVEGKLHNQARLATFKNVKIKVTYFGKDGKKTGEDYFTVYKHVFPELYAPFKHRMKFGHEATHDIKFEIVYALISE